MRIQNWAWLGTFFLALISGQPRLHAQSPDSIFSLEEFLTSVQLHHPIALQAGLLTERARAELLFARGFLDPVVTADWDQKNFDDKLYWQTYRGKLTVPTALGIDLVAGYEQTTGQFLNPEQNTSERGLWNVGLEAEVLQGLIVNERRIALDRANVIQELNENQRQAAINELLYDAGKAYVEWQKFFYYGEVLDSNFILADNYFEATKSSFEAGEYTAMDTLEAFIQLQDAVTMLQKNANELVKARQTMENYLWFNGTPLELQPGIQPSPLPPGVPLIDIDPSISLVARNPEILAFLNEQEILQIEQRLKRVKTRPKLKVKYNPLLATTEESLRPTYSMNDFKWGFDFSMPLLLRQSRAEVQLGEIKIRETAFKIQAKQNELNNKLQASLAQIDILRDQVGVTADNVDRYARLLQGERDLFFFGESSVFLLNKRQEKYIESQLKLIELKAKIRKELLNYRFLANDLIFLVPN